MEEFFEYEDLLTFKLYLSFEQSWQMSEYYGPNVGIEEIMIEVWQKFR